MTFQRKNQKIKGSFAAGLFFIFVSSIILLSIGNNPTHGAETSTERLQTTPGQVFYVRIEGQSGYIDGSVTASGYLRWIAGYQYSHSVYIPTDPHSGQMSGSRVHTPVKILKLVDNSTPLLFKAMIQIETLIRVEIHFFDPTGGQHYFTVLLEDAKIISIREFQPNVMNPDTYQPLVEEVAFGYKKITWTWEEPNIEFSDDWVYPGSD